VEIRRPSCLSRRLGVDGEGMEAIGEFGRQKSIHQPVPGDPREPRKPSRDDSHAIVRTPGGPRARMPGMTVGFVNDVQMLRL
jgi:hypothetical protein